MKVEGTIYYKHEDDEWKYRLEFVINYNGSYQSVLDIEGRTDTCTVDDYEIAGLENLEIMIWQDDKIYNQRSPEFDVTSGNLDKYFVLWLRNLIHNDGSEIHEKITELVMDDIKLRVFPEPE